MSPQTSPDATSKYRPAKPLPFELRSHCRVYFEEKLYLQALNLLLSIISSGTVSTGAAFVPPPQHLALAATLVVHPSTTTRAKSVEYSQAANLALQLLHLTNTLVGPKASNFNVAFTFTRFTSSRHGGRRRTDDTTENSGTFSDENTEPINLGLSQNGSLWSRAEDFWQVVGWAFNCSVLHPKRWTRWHVFLQFMCDTLEDDWNQREEEFNDMSSRKQTKASWAKQDRSVLTESLIFKYISSTSSVSGPHRRVLRAIFADGAAAATNEFRQVFHNELKELDQDKDNLKKREVDVNVDEEIFGDYLDSHDWEEDDEEGDHQKRSDIDERRPTRAKRPRRTKSSKGDGADYIKTDTGYEAPGIANYDKLDHLGNLQSLSLRQRLLRLLSRVSVALPEDFIPVEKLYLLYVEFIRHLPLPIFQLLVSPSVLLCFPPSAQTTLCEMLLFRLRETAAPDSNEPYLSQNKLEHCFLPYTTNTNSVFDNAKVSILLESLLRLLMADGLLYPRPSLTEAVETGILARADKAQTDIKRSQNRQLAEELGWICLIESGERMTSLLGKLVPK